MASLVRQGCVEGAMTFRASAEKTFIRSFSKRGFDIVAAIGGLLLLSPLILLTSLVIKIESSGPILCRHKRYSYNNVEFETFEFRTTLVDRREKRSRRERDEMQCITGFGYILRYSGV